MPVPDTDNPHFQQAFKQGYRMGLQRKSIDLMPASLRQDPKVRRYFEMGWQQANDEMAQAQALQGKPDWKSRSVWFVFAIITGVLTAKLMITNIEAEREAQQARIAPPVEIIDPAEPIATGYNQLRLLNPASFNDLQASQQAFRQLEHEPLSPLVDSDLQIEQSQLYSSAGGQAYEWQQMIPKYERQLKAVLQISAPDDAEITVRWRYQTQIISEAYFSLSKGLNSIQAEQSMSSSRQGIWYLELLEKQNVIYRQDFSYGSLSTNP